MTMEQTRTVIFYPPRRGVLVTDRVFRAHGRAFRIDGLTDVVWGYGSVQTARRMTIRLVAVEALIAAMIAIVIPTSLAILAVIGYLLFASVMIWFAMYRWPTPLELWSDYFGEPIKLYVSTDRTEFQQIWRALQRAIELRGRRSLR